MFRLIPTETVPETVYRHLLPWERQVITVRYHYAAVAAPIAAVIGGLVAAIVVSAAGVSADAEAIVWPVWLLLLVYSLGRMRRWLDDYFVVTSQRLLIVTGLLTRDVAMIPMAEVSHLRFRRSFMGRMLGYGTFLLVDAGWGPSIRTISFLPYPEQLYLEVCGLIFRDPAVVEDEVNDGEDGDKLRGSQAIPPLRGGI